MPRFDNRYLDCPVYLYPSKKSAYKGDKHGGTGFLVHIPFKEEINGVLRSHVYVVTNSHVIREAKSTVIRMNKANGKPTVLDYQYRHWIDDWDQNDLAMCMIDDTIMHKHHFLMPGLEDFVSEDDVASWDNPDGVVDYGSDVMMVGRFIAHDGTQRNYPVVRFGSISMLNVEEIGNKRRDIKGKPYINMEESFLVECRTIPGTSGSPVFLTHLASDGGTIPKEFLGVVWGYMYYNPKEQEEFGWDTNLNTGMAQVIPAWKLAQFLERPDLMKMREQIEQEEQEKARQRQPGAGQASAIPDPEEIKVFTKEDFHAALKKVSRPDQPQSDEEK